MMLTCTARKLRQVLGRCDQNMTKIFVTQYGSTKKLKRSPYGISGSLYWFWKFPALPICRELKTCRTSYGCHKKLSTTYCLQGVVLVFLKVPHRKTMRNGGITIFHLRISQKVANNLLSSRGRFGVFESSCIEKLCETGVLRFFIKCFRCDSAEKFLKGTVLWFWKILVAKISCLRCVWRFFVENILYHSTEDFCRRTP